MLLGKNKLYISVTGLILACSLLGTSSCTKLDEDVYGSKYVDSVSAGGSGGVATAADLVGVYDQLNSFSNQDNNAYALSEHPSDEMMGPTRGTDWDDFGTWRKLHLHTWDASHNQIYAAWNGLNGAAFRATLVVEKAPDPQIKAEGSFLRAFFTFFICDLWGQVPYRSSSAKPDDIPTVYSRKDAVGFMTTDLENAITTLPSANPSGKASKEAAEFLLAKIMLNKAVYSQDPATPAGPFTFDAADMTKVITLCNAITASNKYQLTDAGKYWDNFKWDNATVSKELIFTRDNTNASQPANVRARTYMGFHYNQTPGGWNGFTTLADFYNSFDPVDERRGISLPGFTDSLGYPTGFLIGQQHGYKKNSTGGYVYDATIAGPNKKILVDLKQRDGNPLVFTPDVSLFFSTEAKGIRVVKYPLDPTHIDNSANSYVFFRYADVLLMKAEALMRGGTDANGQTALGIINDLRMHRSLPPLDGLTLPQLLAERGHELYYEGWRRNDHIRFGTFNDPVNERPVKSSPTRVVFPIPVQAVATNPNLKQNVGY